MSPILEPNVSEWIPYHIGNIRKNESAQVTFTRLVRRKLNFNYDTYEHCFSFSNFITLEILRFLYKSILAF